MAKEIYVEMNITKKVVIDLTGYNVDITNPESIKKYIKLYADGYIDCHENTIDYHWEVTDYKVANKKKGDNKK